MAPDVPLLRGDERQTMQIILNLLTNAIKFMPRRDRMTRRSGRRPVDRVADTGIAQDNPGRVLEPCERVDSSLSRKQRAPVSAYRRYAR